MKVSERKISRQMKVSKIAVPNIIKNFKRKILQEQQKTSRPRIFSNRNKRFIRKGTSQFTKSFAEKIQAKMA